MSTSAENTLTRIFSSPENLYSSGLDQAALAKREAKNSNAPTGAQNASDQPPVRVTLSEEALRKAGLLKGQPKSTKTGAPVEPTSTSTASSAINPALNSSESRTLENLKRIDRNVRAHEQAHVIAGGSLVRGAAQFGYATGPDGRLYAVSGEVSIDSGPVPDDPEATIRKMLQVTKAALAPPQPSGQDRAVASAATQTQVDAQRALTQLQLEKNQESSTKDEKTTPPTDSSEARQTEKDTSKAARQETYDRFPLSNSQNNSPGKTTFQNKVVNIQA